MKNPQSARKYFSLWDLIVLSFILATITASLIFLFLPKGNTSAPVAEIRVNSTLTQSIDLSQVTTPYTLTVEGNFPVTLYISSEEVHFLSSSCKDKLCIHTGEITAGKSAACLPAGVSVTVRGSDSPVDTMVG